ncbi:FERM domain-containing protein 1 isoform X1 [Ictalurus punctatus]|uniref:FERM domain-containing protein 1 isoform X1 n=1 Tax=Ictalurus punctatus TaxID=7998 RepID=A0A2D0S5X9_ICTPU|nr:FERM domain-containing protein 1 isoform X1 [Ictalurus punctatus]
MYTMLKKVKNMPNSAHQTSTLCVVVLPNKTQLHIAVGLKCRGQEVISQLSQLLGITNLSDLHLFGLSLEKEKDHLFLDLEKKLTTYFSKTWKQTTLPGRVVLYLRVEYYIRNGRQIIDGKVRSLYCADLKNRVLSSQCYGQEGLYFQLAAYALQADLGDWKEGMKPYFTPQDYFPPWVGHYVILARRGCDFVVQHTPDLHRELRGMSTHDASLLFIEEACGLSDVPLTFYSMSKGKKVNRASLLLGVALTGVHIYDIETAIGGYHLLYEFAWSSIDCLKFQGRRFEIKVDSLAGEVLVMYTQSVMHSQQLLKHISNNHHVHLNTKHSFKQLQTRERRQQREVYIRDSTDPESEESEDELPPIKSYLDKARQRHADTMATITLADDRDTAWGSSRKGQKKTDLAGLDQIELSVDEPEEMFVDDPEEITQLTELLEGVSVDGPPLVTVSHWIDISMEMKQVLKWRACSLSLDQCRENVENLKVSHMANSPEEHVDTLHVDTLTYKHGQEDIIF